ncbi:MAG: aspartyl/glutamyl-tRNA amidotransferase subunit C [Gemmatimonadota bacterium]
MSEPSGDGGIGREQVLHIAHLARLRLEAEEVELFTRQLNDILGHAQEIAEAAEEGAVPDDERPRPGAAALRLREGVAEADPLLAPLSAFAPAFPDGLFAVPRLEAMDDEPSP